jgi:hypothetical protein
MDRGESRFSTNGPESAPGAALSELAYPDARPEPQLSSWLWPMLGAERERPRGLAQAGLLALWGERKGDPGGERPEHLGTADPILTRRLVHRVDHPCLVSLPKSTLQGQAVTLKAAPLREAVRWRTQRTDL